MPDERVVPFRRIRVPMGDREIWIDWNDRGDGTAPVPFTLWTVPGAGFLGSIDCRVVTEADEVGWRRAPDPEAGPGEDAGAGAGPAQGAQG